MSNSKPLPRLCTSVGKSKGKKFLYNVTTYTQKTEFRLRILSIYELGTANSCLPFGYEKRHCGVLILVVVKGVSYKL